MIIKPGETVEFKFIGKGMKLEAKDISAETFGKFQYMTEHEGHWYSDMDWDYRNQRPRDGSDAQDGFIYRVPSLKRNLFGFLRGGK